MEIPNHIVDGLGMARVSRIRMAFEYAIPKLGKKPSQAVREQLALRVVIESRDTRASVGWIALRALEKLPKENESLRLR
jgi:hypothetical protein